MVELVNVIWLKQIDEPHTLQGMRLLTALQFPFRLRHLFARIPSNMRSAVAVHRHRDFLHKVVHPE
jgi:hypothetical protein